MRLSDKNQRAMAWFVKEQYQVPGQEILSSLTEESVTKVQKESSVADFLREIKSRRDEILSQVTRIKDAIWENQGEQERCQKIIDDCEARKTTFSEIPDSVALKNEINREFEKRGIQSEARFACEYVLGLQNEDWRDSIEGYLGRRRYTILVEPEYYDIADDVLNASKYKYAHLFNTKLLMKKQVLPEEDSVVQFIEVRNPVAKQYFNYQLGRFHAVAMDQVRNHENAMSKEGRVSVAMDSYFLNFHNIRFYCLGQESIEINRIKAVKCLEHLRQSYGEYKGRLMEETGKQSYLDTEMEFLPNTIMMPTGNIKRLSLTAPEKKQNKRHWRKRRSIIRNIWNFPRESESCKRSCRLLKLSEVRCMRINLRCRPCI